MIAAGHPADMVLNDYTVDELEIFYEAVIRGKADQMVETANTVRVGHHAGKRDWTKFTKQMGNVWKDIENAAGRPIMKTETFFKGLERTAASFREKKSRKEEVKHGTT